MKKVLLLIMLCPLMALSQGNLVTWNSTSQPTGLTNLTAQAISGGGGVTIGQESWAGGFQIKEIHYSNNSAINTNKYVEFRANPNTGYQIKPTEFVLMTRWGDQQARKMEVRASKDGSTWTSLTNSAAQTVFTVTGSNQTFTLNFPTGYTVLPSETLRIRVYYYDLSFEWYSDMRILTTLGSSSTPGPTLRGTVTPAGGVMANNDTATTVTGYATTINVTNNDTATNTTISAVNVISQPANGTATMQGNNIVYTPNAGFAGTNTFQYRITGADNSTSTATVTVTVGAMIQPVANNDSTTTDRNVAKTINVLGNDAIGSGAVTAVNVTTSAQHGTTVVNGDRTITYTPATGYTGPDSFRYTLTDQYNNTATATVSVSVLKPLNIPLEGTYYVGTNGEFASITAAVANLNEYGVSGPVKFLLTNTSYTSTTESFPIIINSIVGNSVTNTVTFKPAPSTSVNIQVNDITVSNNNYQAIAAFVINGVANVIFDGSNTATGTTRNLTVNNNNSIAHLHRTVFWIGSNTSRVTIKNTNIRMGVKNQGERFCTGVYMGDYQITGSLNSRQMVIAEAANAISNINVVNNDFMNVKQGIYVNGGTGTANATNIVIHQNDLGSENNLETIIQPAALNNVNGFDYTENLVYNLYRDNDAGNLISSGVYVTGASKNGNIMRNNMRDLTRTAGTGSAFAGVALNSSEAASNIVIANNFILNVVAVASGAPNQNGHGIFVMTGGGYKIYHNTVSLNTNPTGLGYSAALYVGPTVTGLDVRNNILVNNQTNADTRRCAILIDNTAGNINTVFTHLDYNNYYSTDRIGYIGGSNHGVSNSNNPGYITTFSVWKSATGKDANTVEFNPVFASATDLHLTTGNGAIDNEGTPIPGITKDIDGQLRSTQHPTIGADEYGEPTPPTPGDNTGVYCETSTTWNGTEWSNGLPDASKDAIFSGNFTKTGGTLEACSMFVLASANVNFISNSNAIITHNVTVVTGGSLTFESGSNLVQIENTANSGKVTVKRNSSKLKRLDYTMWASPVSGQNLLAFSPVTMADRFYTYNTTTNQYNSIVPSANSFTAGKGYLIRMPNSNAAPGYNARTAAIVFSGEFKGTPHNGNVRIPLNYNNNTQSYNAVGNPYPSPINILDFLEANADNIDGTFYIWRKTNDHTILSSYWTCNKSGATANSAPGGGGSGGNDTNDLIFDPYKADPTGLLSTGQGFIVKAKSANRELVFRNNMRRTINNSFILRNGNVNNGDAPEAATANRIWLNVTNDADAFSQALIAYMPQATEGYDDGYDGVSLMDGGVNLYTLQADNKLAIQSRPDFVNTDVVNLGFKTNVAGNFEIKIDHTDGIFEEDQVIYVKDNETNTVHNLQESSYSFTSEAGTFNSRFEIVYVPNGSLGTDTPVVASKDVLVYRDAKQIKVAAPQAITSITVYDLTGKTIFEKNNIDAAEFTTADINAASQVVIVKVLLENGQAVAKKIMMN